MRTLRNVFAFFTFAIVFGGWLYLSIYPVTLLAASVQSPEVDMNLSAFPTSVSAGEQVTFSVRITNTSGITLDNLKIFDQLPPELQAVTINYTVKGGTNISTAVSGRFYTLTAQSLAISGSVVLTIPGQIQNGLANNAIVTNYVDFNALVEGNPVTAMDSTSVTVTNASGVADLAISKSSNVTVVNVSSQVGYTIVVDNLGTAPAQSLIITDVAPASMYWNTGKVSSRNAFSPTFLLASDRVTVTFDSLAVMGKITLLLTGTVYANVGDGTILTNFAHVQSEQESELNNNVASAAITIHNPQPIATPTFVSTATPTTSATSIVTASQTPQSSGTPSPVNTSTFTSTPTSTSTSSTPTSSTPTSSTPTETATSTFTPTHTPTPTRTPTRAADLAITKTANVASVKAGDAFTYTVVILNVGDVDVTNVLMTDTLQSGVRFVNGRGFTLGAGNSQLHLGAQTSAFTTTTLAKGGWISVTLAAIVESDVISGTTILNQADVSADNDSNATNNQASYLVGVGFVPIQEDRHIYLPVVSR